MENSLPPNLDDYSPSSTTIKFDNPVPLLRGPIPAAPPDDPSMGPYVLAFKNPQSYAAAYRSCLSKIIQQCEEGTRIGCAISASNKCRPSWWRALIGWKSVDLKERERCEEREMEGCLAVAKEKCVGFAKDKCLWPFRDARIAVGERKVSSKQVEKLVCWVSTPERSLWVDLIGLDQLGSRFLANYDFRVTNYRASEILGFDPNFECFSGEESDSKSLKVKSL